MYRELLFRVSFLLRQSRFRMGEFMILYSRLRSKYQVVLNGGNSYAFQELLHSFDEKVRKRSLSGKTVEISVQGA